MKHGSSFRYARIALACVASISALAITSWGAGKPNPGQGKDQDKNGLVLKTPSGGFEMSGKVKASDVGLPVYPGARQVEAQDKSNGSLTFNLSRSGKPDVKFLVAKFETEDSVDQVRDYYKKKLGREVTKFNEKTKDGVMSFEMKKGDHERKYVQIKTGNGRTEIDLVRLAGVSFSDSDDRVEVN